MIYKWKDFLIVMRPLWIIIVFQLLIATSLNLPAQGQDMMFIVIEDIFAGSYWSSFWFVVALFYLSVVSEFGVRFILNLSNITTLNLAQKRIRYRKLVQKKISKIVLFAPALFSLAGFIKTYIYIPNHDLRISFLIIVLVITAAVFLLYLIYFGMLRNSLYVLPLNKHAQALLAKLSGIFEVYNFGTAAIPNLKRLTYRDFAPLLKRFSIGLFFSFILILTFSFLPIGYYALIGGTALIILSFACWLSVYYAIEFLDKVQPFKIQLPFKLLVLILLLSCSYFNSDHPVRENFQTKLKNNVKKELPTYLAEWLKNSHRDTTKTIPMLFIAAEGGALRTGCFTSMMLANLKDKYDHGDTVLKTHLFCYSSVSGGSLGVNFFNGLQNVNYQEKYTTATRAFYRQDFLSPTTGKLVFGEIINYFMPHQFQVFDRAVALEKSWELAWDSIPNSNQYRNALAGNFDMLDTSPSPHPLVFINTTEVETGRKAVVSNIRIDSINFQNTTDFFSKIHHPINYSTAIGLSARFPLLSPAGMVQVDQENKLHYTDGGYYENTGTETLQDVIAAVKKDPIYGAKIEPYVILFSFGERDTTSQKGINFLNELTEVVSGIYNVRSGHSDRSVEELERMIDPQNFIQIALPVSARNVPMNWVLSSRALSVIDMQCDSIIEKPKLKKWFTKDFLR